MSKAKKFIGVAAAAAVGAALAVGSAVAAPGASVGVSEPPAVDEGSTRLSDDELQEEANTSYEAAVEQGASLVLPEVVEAVSQTGPDGVLAPDPSFTLGLRLQVLDATGAEVADAILMNQGDDTKSNVEQAEGWDEVGNQSVEERGDDLVLLHQDASPGWYGTVVLLPDGDGSVSIAASGPEAREVVATWVDDFLSQL